MKLLPIDNNHSEAGQGSSERHTYRAGDNLCQRSVLCDGSLVQVTCVDVPHPRFLQQVEILSASGFGDIEIVAGLVGSLIEVRDVLKYDDLLIWMCPRAGQCLPEPLFLLLCRLRSAPRGADEIGIQHDAKNSAL